MKELGICHKRNGLLLSSKLMKIKRIRFDDWLDLGLSRFSGNRFEDEKWNDRVLREIDE